MKNQYHILNGDALKQQFPEQIQGKIIIARECLVEGTVQGKETTELYAARAAFLSKAYGGTEQNYYNNVVTEFQKIEDIEEDTDIHLWFEDDLFCQVNFWYVVHLLQKKAHNNTVYLIRPEFHTQYGFGGLHDDALVAIYKNKAALTELELIASLWPSYQTNDTTQLVHTGKKLAALYPFILDAIEAHIARIPTPENPGRPTQTLIEIMKDLETETFEPVFKEFCKREPIYGFGDLQVKRLFDEILSNR